MLTIKSLTIFLAVLVLLFVLELVREEKLTFKYALGWIFVAVVGILMTVFDQVVIDITHWLGFELASNFIFFTLLTIFIFLALLMTIFLCQQNSRNDAMAQKIAMLEFEIDQLKKESSKKEK